MEQITGYHSMPLTKLQIAPGIDKQNTEYGAEGRWVDSDNIRFRYGQPEKISLHHHYLDFRIEGNGDANLFFSDAGNDRIGIKTNSPSTELHVVGGVKATGAIDFDGGGFTFNDSHAAVDFRAETDTLTHAFFIDGSADKIGFGTDSPADASVEINQANSSGAIACLSLDQDDTDQEFIKFDGTSNSDQSSSITTDTSVGSLTGHIRVNVNGTDYWIPFYATN